MRLLLHVLSEPDNAWAAELIDQQKLLADTRVVVADLSGTDPDYERLLEQIFAADSVAVW